ncbi:phosphoribosylanthranilate isomerase [Bernardetia litoralis DSM 6794]|uniref:Phosphoribosylanthranilate isomerase n=1 Tax=Bernardetia litoralis (strain ATCC 23117 / DSM 6794 / NBRC 15988 / NCIMB 1366 / Fx l1 / Sio-4) TaxID=880071 RepID=I4AIE4_BERLS|nr:phosphoribosylanthranilate isomerase [Bernardetia litoralis]AFM03729.1 phosphoribosylanthranilate isomerase [Bernardetia litoralis DSM 6794]
MPTPIIKLSSITNLHDARFGAGMGTVLDMMIGFSLNPNSNNFVSEEDFAQISGWITGCKIVAEIEGNTISEEAHKILSNKDYTIDFIQISQKSILSELQSKDYKFPIIFCTKLENLESITTTNLEIDYFLIESNEENLTQKEIEILKNKTKKFPIILGFGITNENVIDLLTETELKGIAFKGQTEIEVGMGGYTDFDEISDILEKVEEL